MSPAPVDRAIVVGINRYPHFGRGDGAPRELKGPVFDAREMADWLTSAAGAHVTLITSEGVRKPYDTLSSQWEVEDLRPDLNDVTREFREIVIEGENRVAAYAPSRLGRRLYVYMAGHGYAPDPRSLSLILADAVGDKYLSNIEATAWVDWFATQTYFDEFVLWMDCCGTLLHQYAGGKPPGNKDNARPNGRGAIFMGFAAGSDRLAYEGPIGPGGQVRGLFTDRLLRGLKGAAAEENGDVTSDSLIKYLRNRTSLVGEAPTQNAPSEMRPLFPETDPMVFVNTKKEGYVLRVSLPDGTPLDLTGPAGIPPVRVTVQGGAAAVPLNPGLYKASAPGFSQVFEIAAGTVGDVDLR